LLSRITDTLSDQRSPAKDRAGLLGTAEAVLDGGAVVPGLDERRTGPDTRGGPSDGRQAAKAGIPAGTAAIRRADAIQAGPGRRFRPGRTAARPRLTVPALRSFLPAG